MSDTAASFAKPADTHVTLHPLLAARWSPRAYDRDAVLEPDVLERLLEAARWSPSASNSQPWRFAAGLRGDAAFGAIHDALLPGNSVWADSASALVLAVAATTKTDGSPQPWAVYDLGQAVAHLTVQAQHEGLHTHQMAGFDKDAARRAFGLADGLEPTTVIAIGTVTSPEGLSDQLRERETAVRVRRPLSETLLAVAD